MQREHNYIKKGVAWLTAFLFLITQGIITPDIVFAESPLFPVEKTEDAKSVSTPGIDQDEMAKRIAEDEAKKEEENEVRQATSTSFMMGSSLTISNDDSHAQTNYSLPAVKQNDVEIQDIRLPSTITLTTMRLHMIPASDEKNAQLVRKTEEGEYIYEEVGEEVADIKYTTVESEEGEGHTLTFQLFDKDGELLETRVVENFEDVVKTEEVVNEVNPDGSSAQTLPPPHRETPHGIIMYDAPAANGLQAMADTNQVQAIRSVYYQPKEIFATLVMPGSEPWDTEGKLHTINQVEYRFTNGELVPTGSENLPPRGKEITFNGQEYIWDGEKYAKHDPEQQIQTNPVDSDNPLIMTYEKLGSKLDDVAVSSKVEKQSVLDKDGNKIGEIHSNVGYNKEGVPVMMTNSVNPGKNLMSGWMTNEQRADLLRRIEEEEQGNPVENVGLISKKDEDGNVVIDEEGRIVMEGGAPVISKPVLPDWTMRASGVQGELEHSEGGAQGVGSTLGASVTIRSHTNSEEAILKELATVKLIEKEDDEEKRSYLLNVKEESVGKEIALTGLFEPCPPNPAGFRCMAAGTQGRQVIRFVKGPGPDVVHDIVLNTGSIELDVIEIPEGSTFRLIINGSHHHLIEAEERDVVVLKDPSDTLDEMQTVLEDMNKLKEKLSDLEKELAPLKEKLKELKDKLNGKTNGLIFAIRKIEEFVIHEEVIQKLEALQGQLKKAIEEGSNEKIDEILASFEKLKEESIQAPFNIPKAFEDLDQRIESAIKRIPEVEEEIVEVIKKIEERTQERLNDSFKLLKEFEDVVESVERVQGKYSAFFAERTWEKYRQSLPMITHVWPLVQKEIWIERHVFDLVLKNGEKIQVTFQNGEMDPLVLNQLITIREISKKEGVEAQDIISLAEPVWTKSDRGLRHPTNDPPPLNALSIDRSNELSPLLGMSKFITFLAVKKEEKIQKVYVSKAIAFDHEKNFARELFGESGGNVVFDMNSLKEEHLKNSDIDKNGVLDDDDEQIFFKSYFQGMNDTGKSFSLDINGDYKETLEDVAVFLAAKNRPEDLAVTTLEKYKERGNEIVEYVEGRFEELDKTLAEYEELFKEMPNKLDALAVYKDTRKVLLEIISLVRSNKNDVTLALYKEAKLLLKASAADYRKAFLKGNTLHKKFAAIRRSATSSRAYIKKLNDRLQGVKSESSAKRHLDIMERKHNEFEDPRNVELGTARDAKGRLIYRRNFFQLTEKYGKSLKKVNEIRIESQESMEAKQKRMNEILDEVKTLRAEKFIAFGKGRVSVKDGVLTIEVKVKSPADVFPPKYYYKTLREIEVKDDFRFTKDRLYANTLDGKRLILLSKGYLYKYDKVEDATFDELNHRMLYKLLRADDNNYQLIKASENYYKYGVVDGKRKLLFNQHTYWRKDSRGDLYSTTTIRTKDRGYVYLRKKKDADGKEVVRIAAREDGAGSYILNKTVDAGNVEVIKNNDGRILEIRVDLNSTESYLIHAANQGDKVQAVLVDPSTDMDGDVTNEFVKELSQRIMNYLVEMKGQPFEGFYRGDVQSVFKNIKDEDFERVKTLSGEHFLDVMGVLKWRQTTENSIGGGQSIRDYQQLTRNILERILPLGFGLANQSDLDTLFQYLLGNVVAVNGQN